MLTISNLEKCVSILKKYLEKQGYTCELYTHKSGRGGDSSTNVSSYVELTVYENNQKDDYDTKAIDIRFIAYGYYGGNKSDIFGDRWSTMKKQALERIERFLPK